MALPRRMLGLAAALLALSTAARAADVDVALAVAIDVSYSVDSLEHGLQMKGLAEALMSANVLEAIKSGEHQKIAITVFQWADADKQKVLVPWTVIDGEASASTVSAKLMPAPRIVEEGGTGISGALLFGAALFAKAPPADRQVIDVSTDGRNNMGRPVKVLRDFVLSQGITINGLAISNEWTNLRTYLENNVVGGPANFVEEALTYDDFGAAMQRKLLKEIIGPGVM